MSTALSLLTSGINSGPRRGHPIAIRFVPHDQWFLTHIGAWWKIKDVKNHTLARCLNLSNTPPDPPPSFSMSMTDPSQPHSPSPITFAPDPIDRGESPILFAVMKPKSPHSEEEDTDDEDDFTMNLDVKGKAKQVYDEHGRAVMGLRMVPSATRVTSVGGPSDTPVRSKWAQYNEDPKIVPEIAHLSFTLIRFSTGQLLEDDLTVSDYNLKPHELLELHLSISPPSPDHVTATSFLPPTPTFPFPLLAAPPQLLQAKSKKKRAQIEALVAPHVTRLVSLPRSVPQAYAAPYWEGWIRILRLASREDEDYMYGGHTGGVGSAGKGKQKAGTPGYAQYGGGHTFGDWGVNGATMMGEEKDLDLELARNFGMNGLGPGVPVNDPGLPQYHANPQIRTSKSKFEWRERWLIIREGWLFLLKERGDVHPSHAFPLANLVNLRDADQLTDSLDNAKRRRVPRPAAVRPRGAGPNARSPPRTGTARLQPKSPPSRSQTTVTTSNSTVRGEEPRSPQQRQYHLPTRSRDLYEDASQYTSHPSSSPPRTTTIHPSLKSEYIDPFSPRKVNKRLFVPKSKEEAEAMGMKIICTKFRQPTVYERKMQPDPFFGSNHASPPSLDSALAAKYVSFGPSLDERGGSAGGPINSGGFVDQQERVQYERERDLRERREREKQREDEAKEKARKLKEKQSVPHSLQRFASPNVGDRRPSLPALNTKTSGSSLFGIPSASTSGMTLSSIFATAGTVMGIKDGKRKRKEKEKEKALKAKDKGKGKGKEVDRVLHDFSTFGMVSGRPPRRHDGARQVRSTGEIPEPRFISPFMAGPSHPVEPRPPIEVAPHVKQPSVTEYMSEGESHLAEGEEEEEEEEEKEEEEDEGEDDKESEAEVEAAVDPEAKPTEEQPAEATSAEPSTPVDTNSEAHMRALALKKFEEGIDEHSPESGSEYVLSSPVFARDGSDGDDSELDNFLGIRKRQYIYDTTDTRRSKTGADLQLPNPNNPSSTSTGGLSGHHRATVSDWQSDPEEDMEEENEETKVTPTKPKTSKPASPPLRSSAASHKSRTTSITTNSTVTQRKVSAGRQVVAPKNFGAKGQWIIMDVGSDAAYHSLLRVLHRTIEAPLASSFLAALPSLFTDVRTPTPPTKEPLSPQAPAFSDPFVSQPPPPAPSSATSATFPKDLSSSSSSRSIPPRPYESTVVMKTRKMLGTLQYPEWRLRAVNLARRASMGVVAQPLEVMAMTMGTHPDPGYVRADSALVDPMLVDPMSESESEPESEGGGGAGSGRNSEDVPVAEMSEAEREEAQLKKVYNMGFESTDEDDKEASDMEWQGWTADISRQVRVTKEAKIRAEQEAALQVILAQHQQQQQQQQWQQWQQSQSQDYLYGGSSDEDGGEPEEESEFDILPTSPAEERLLVMKRRFAMEPLGVVSSKTTSTELAGLVANVPSEPNDPHGHHGNDHHRMHHQSKRNLNTVSLLAGRTSLLSKSASLDSVRRYHHQEHQEEEEEQYSASGGSTTHAGYSSATLPSTSAYDSYYQGYHHPQQQTPPSASSSSFAFSGTPSPRFNNPNPNPNLNLGMGMGTSTLGVPAQTLKHSTSMNLNEPRAALTITSEQWGHGVGLGARRQPSLPLLSSAGEVGAGGLVGGGLVGGGVAGGPGGLGGGIGAGRRTGRGIGSSRSPSRSPASVLGGHSSSSGPVRTTLIEFKLEETENRPAIRQMGPAQEEDVYSSGPSSSRASPLVECGGGAPLGSSHSWGSGLGGSGTGAGTGGRDGAGTRDGAGNGIGIGVGVGSTVRRQPSRGFQRQPSTQFQRQSQQMAPSPRAELGGGAYHYPLPPPPTSPRPRLTVTTTTSITNSNNTGNANATSAVGGSGSGGAGEALSSTWAGVTTQAETGGAAGGQYLETPQSPRRIRSVSSFLRRPWKGE